MKTKTNKHKKESKRNNKREIDSEFDNSEHIEPSPKRRCIQLNYRVLPNKSYNSTCAKYQIPLNDAIINFETTLISNVLSFDEQTVDYVINKAMIYHRKDAILGFSKFRALKQQKKTRNNHNISLNYNIPPIKPIPPILPFAMTKNLSNIPENQPVCNHNNKNNMHTNNNNNNNLNFNDIKINTNEYNMNHSNLCDIKSCPPIPPIPKFSFSSNTNTMDNTDNIFEDIQHATIHKTPINTTLFEKRIQINQQCKEKQRSPYSTRAKSVTKRASTMNHK